MDTMKLWQELALKDFGLKDERYCDLIFSHISILIVYRMNEQALSLMSNYHREIQNVCDENSPNMFLALNKMY